MSRLRLILAATALLSPTLAAQTTPALDPVVQRLWTLGMEQSQTEQLAHVLLDSLGPRLPGSPNIKAAQDWVARTYQSWGIEARNEQYGTWRGWRRGVSHIDMISPRVRSLEGTMLAFSPGTGGRNLDATTIILPRFADSTEFVRWLPAVRGKLVMISAAQPTCRPAEDWRANGTPASAEAMATLRAETTRDFQARIAATGYSAALGGGSLGIRLEQAGAAGSISSRPKVNAWGTMEIFETYNTTTPTIALSCEDYGLVYRLTDSGRIPTLRLNLDAELLGEQPVFNTIGVIRGTEKPDEVVLLSAHFDSWDGSSGATDNGTGTLTMMEALRILKIAYPAPKRTIMVGHWSNEEVGLVGSRAFAEDHPEIVAGLQAVFNQDNGTGRVVRLGGGGMVNAPTHVNAWMAKLPTVFQEQVNFGGPGRPSGGGTDEASFACHGAPGFGLGAAGWNYGNYTWHTDRDTYDKVVFDDLRSNATLTAMLAYLASEDPVKVSRERVEIPTNPNGGGGWPTCAPAPRSTSPRLR